MYKHIRKILLVLAIFTLAVTACGQIIVGVETATPVVEAPPAGEQNETPLPTETPRTRAMSPSSPATPPAPTRPSLAWSGSSGRL